MSSPNRYSNRRPALPRAEYTIGWLCILNCEYQAARAMLDEEHESIYLHDPQEDKRQLFSTGLIAGHAVVIACSGRAGNMTMYKCASVMQSAFVNITTMLLVGIGGGVANPPAADIRLGDVVVAAGRDGGVAVYGQHDKLTDAGVQRRRHVLLPSRAVTSVVDRMQTEKDSLLVKILGAAVPETCLAAMKLEDVLYQTADTSSPVYREARTTLGPAVHLGLIASGDSVVKTTGNLRQDILDNIDGDVLCFEMEAAGVMGNFPCLVVRGISDYCDPHKNDAWHDYAASAAAAYGKWYLNELPLARQVIPDRTLAPDSMQASAGADQEALPMELTPPPPAKPPRLVPAPTTPADRDTAASTKPPRLVPAPTTPADRDTAVSTKPNRKGGHKRGKSSGRSSPSPAENLEPAAWHISKELDTPTAPPDLLDLVTTLFKLDLCCIKASKLWIEHLPVLYSEYKLPHEMRKFQGTCSEELAELIKEHELISRGERKLKARYAEDDILVKYWYISSEAYQHVISGYSRHDTFCVTMKALLSEFVSLLVPAANKLCNVNTSGRLPFHTRKVTCDKWWYTARFAAAHFSLTQQPVNICDWAQLTALLRQENALDREKKWTFFPRTPPNGRDWLYWARPSEWHMRRVR